MQRMQSPECCYFILNAQLTEISGIAHSIMIHIIHLTRKT